MQIGQTSFPLNNRAYIMGILNVTPDSFSDGGSYTTIDAACRQAERMIQEGATILDIGGESTRPGHQQITISEEIRRITPMIKALKERFDIPLSIDTYRGEVAAEAISLGIDLINDIWGLQYDDQMADVVAKGGVPICIMHNRKAIDYQDFWPDLFADIDHSLALAEQAGIPRSQIILDPGVGFAKTYAQNLAIIHQFERFQAYNLPLLIGTSRKGFIGQTLDAPVDERVEGTIITNIIPVQKGCHFIRVHDVLAHARALKMLAAIEEEGSFGQNHC